jgi:hypothetical protein
MSPPVAYISFDGQRIAVNDVVYQMGVLPDTTIRVWEFQVLELMPNGKIRIHHLGDDNEVKMLSLYPKHVCKSSQEILNKYRQEMLELQEKLPRILASADDAIANLPKCIVNTQKIVEYTDMIQEI